MNYNRVIAGVFVGAGGLFCIYKGEMVLATALLTGLLAFLSGEANGTRKTVSDKA